MNNSETVTHHQCIGDSYLYSYEYFLVSKAQLLRLQQVQLRHPQE